jgi:anion-transporting  ArsA/GET3 family ATPase
MSFAALVARHRLIICIGGGGVGKTTIAAAIALGAALSGRRAAVLTIDPARALGRAFGLDQLGAECAPIAPEMFHRAGLRPAGTLHAGMLDQKRAWDALIGRHAPSPELARAVIENPFYRELSSRFAGATEYAAMEQLCWLHESGRFDLIVLDTPPAAHALDFVRAPEQLARLLEPEIARWLSRGELAFGGRARKTSAAAVRWVVRRLERATGTHTLREIGSLASALGAFLEQLRARARAARVLLRGEQAAFTLVATPEQRVLGETELLLDQVRQLRVPLRGVVINRSHPVPPLLCSARATAAVERVAAVARDPAASWLARTLHDAIAIDAAERARLSALSERLAPVARAVVPELDHDLHSLGDLQRVAAKLWLDQRLVVSHPG